MSSTLTFAILGLLAKRPSTGYEVTRAMQRPLGYFWTARHSQIYPELSSLEAQGLIRGEVIAGPGPRDTRRYGLTSLGTAVLTSWLEGPVPEENPKNELMLRVWSLWLCAPEHARALIHEVRARQLAALDAYAFEEREFRRDEGALDDSASQAFGEYATLRFGILQRRSTVTWCDWLLAELGRSPGEGPAAGRLEPPGHDPETASPDP